MKSSMKIVPAERGKTIRNWKASLSIWTVLLGVMTTCSLRAFPPAPHHVIHGLVTDEMGEPILLTSAVVFLETTNGVFIPTQVSPGVRPGENYRLTIPMDSITAPDPYNPVALHATVPFRLKVILGETVYVPLEMAGDFATLGEPAGETLINLTLGVDSDGDGLPDAWEKALIQMLGGGLTLADIDPNGDNDGDGINNYNEYVAGTYAFDPEDGFKLSITRRDGQGPVVQFFAIAGRTYTLLGTTNLVDWTPMTFRVSNGSATALPGPDYYASGSEMTEAEVVFDAAQPRAVLFRIQVR